MECDRKGGKQTGTITIEALNSETIKFNIQAGGAVLGGPMLPVASQASAHRVPDGQHGDSPTANFAMTRHAIDLGPIVRRVPEPNQRRLIETVDALPWNLDTFRGIGSDLLNLRLLDSQLFMAQHAFAHGRDTGHCPLIRGRVAIETRQAQCHVPVVRKLDRLLRECHRGAETQSGNPVGESRHVVQKS